MIVVVDDTRERIALCGLESAVSLQLTAIIRLATRHRNPHVRAVVQELFLSSHWILDSTRAGLPPHSLSGMPEGVGHEQA